MRISGGAARGIPLIVPKGSCVRPATDGMRQAVFSGLGDRVTDARFLDLFAGSGAYGLEAFSRGAAAGVFVEETPRAVECIRRNIDSVCRSVGRAASQLEVVRGDARAAPFGGSSAAAPDLVFIDPPYSEIAAVAPPLFATLLARLATKPDALVLFEMPGEFDLRPDGWALLRRFGKGSHQPTVAVFRRA